MHSFYSFDLIHTLYVLDHSLVRCNVVHFVLWQQRIGCCQWNCLMCHLAIDLVVFQRQAPKANLISISWVQGTVQDCESHKPNLWLSSAISPGLLRMADIEALIQPLLRRGRRKKKKRWKMNWPNTAVPVISVNFLQSKWVLCTAVVLLFRMKGRFRWEYVMSLQGITEQEWR